MKKIVASMALAALSILPAQADSIYRGMRGPTEWQADIRVAESARTNPAGTTTRTMALTPILKYWDGHKHGKWGFIALPYKNVDNGKAQSSGFGDLLIGGGPRGSKTLENMTFNYLSHVAVTLPTGDMSKASALGTGRVDVKAGLATTLLSHDKAKELDAIVEFTRTGKHKVSDELYGGLMLGGKTTANTRLAAGLNGTYKVGGASEGDHLLTSRVALRYIFSQKAHLELWGDVDISSRHMAKGAALTVCGRYNF